MVAAIRRSRRRIIPPRKYDAAKYGSLVEHFLLQEPQEHIKRAEAQSEYFYNRLQTVLFLVDVLEKFQTEEYQERNK